MKLISNQAAYLDRVLLALKRQKLGASDLVEFWRGLPRDTAGRWGKYHKLVPHYYAGYKPRPTNTYGDKRFLKANIEGARFFSRSFTQLKQGMNDRDFFTWLIELHKKQTYTSGMGGKLITKQIINVGKHTPMVADDVTKLAKRFHDPYQPTGKQVLLLPGIRRRGLPVDIWENRHVTHKYPDPKYLSDYIHVLNKAVTKSVRILYKPMPLKTKLIGFARIYQYGVNPRMFIKTNHSLMLNVCNTLLRELKLGVIESGILDFVCMRLRGENFAKYFIEEVKRVNPNREI